MKKLVRREGGREPGFAGVGYAEVALCAGDGDDGGHSGCGCCWDSV